MNVNYPEFIVKSVEILNDGGVIAIPTDTLYALSANTFNSDGIQKVFGIKHRPLNMPVPLFIGELEDLNHYCSDIPELAWKLGETFWPGGLSIVLNKDICIPDTVTGSKGSVALRIPDHPIPRQLVKALKAPLTGTSANISGNPPCTTASEVKDQFGKEIDLIIDGGQLNLNVPSTIVDLTGQIPKILRLGAVSTDSISKVIGKDTRLIR